MNKIGFDNDKYLSMQSEHIRDRIELASGKKGEKLNAGAAAHTGR